MTHCITTTFFANCKSHFCQWSCILHLEFSSMYNCVPITYPQNELDMMWIQCPLLHQEISQMTLYINNHPVSSPLDKKIYLWDLLHHAQSVRKFFLCNWFQYFSWSIPPVCILPPNFCSLPPIFQILLYVTILVSALNVLIFKWVLALWLNNSIKLRKIM